MAIAGDGGMRDADGWGSDCGDSVAGECREAGCDAGMVRSRGCMGLAESMVRAGCRMGCGGGGDVERKEYEEAEGADGEGE